MYTKKWYDDDDDDDMNSGVRCVLFIGRHWASLNRIEIVLGAATVEQPMNYEVDHGY